MLRRRHEPQTSPPTDTEFDRLQEWVLSLPWVVERPDDDNTAGVTCFAVDCEPLGRRRVWLLAGLTNDHHTSGVAVVLPIDAATEIEELGLGYRFAVISDRHVLVAPHVVAATRRQRIETVVLTAYSYAMS